MMMRPYATCAPCGLRAGMGDPQAELALRQARPLGLQSWCATLAATSASTDTPSPTDRVEPEPNRGGANKLGVEFSPKPSRI